MVVLTQPRVAPQATLTTRLSALLYDTQFESELVGHPNRGWVSWLIKSIQDGVHIGYKGVRYSQQAKNLRSSHIHPEAELSKELTAGCIAGPYLVSPFRNTRCSGLGAVPKKNGKWRMIMHLSACHVKFGPPSNRFRVERIFQFLARNFVPRCYIRAAMCTLVSSQQRKTSHCYTKEGCEKTGGKLIVNNHGE